MLSHDIEDPQEPITHIGLLIIHGIGEQCQFESLMEVAKCLFLSIDNNSIQNGLEVYLHINKLDNGPLGAQQRTWDGTKEAPIVLKIKDSLKKEKIWLHLREVWWADVDPPSNPIKILEFWRWGLSLWLTRGFIRGPVLSNFANDLILLEPPTPLRWNNSQNSARKVPLHARIEYFGVAILFCLVQPILSVFNWLLQLIGSNLKIDVFSQYMSKVKLYQQKGKKGKGPIQDLNNPPRFSVLRRIINALVQMGTQDYERWYILSHSLGSIVAFNGLSEPEQSLVNYLDKSTWELARQKQLNKYNNSPVVNPNKIKPSRPSWLEENEYIDRSELFKKLSGLVTYGGPFRHFVDLWPMIMLGNQNNVFSKEFKWFNVYDPSDPVATEAEHLFPNNYTGIRPIDIPYKADMLHLLSHISYLNYGKENDDTLVNRLLNWIIYKNDISITPLNLSSKRWLNKKKDILCYRLLRYVLWWIFGFIGSWLLSFIGQIIYKSFLAWYWIGLIAVVVVVIVSIVENLFREPDDDRIKEFLIANANSAFTLEQITDKFDYPRNKVSKILNSLTNKKIIRKISNNIESYIFPRYKPVAIAAARQELNNPDMQRLLPTIREKLSFTPDVVSDSCISINVEGVDSWLLDVKGDCGNCLLLYEIDRNTQLGDPIVIITQVHFYLST